MPGDPPFLLRPRFGYGKRLAKHISLSQGVGFIKLLKRDNFCCGGSNPSIANGKLVSLKGKTSDAAK
jgi:hypothetical protein